MPTLGLRAITDLAAISSESIFALFALTSFLIHDTIMGAVQICDGALVAFYAFPRRLASSTLARAKIESRM